jgi:glycosyltransferase involved in cell wall biosynthesis
LRILHVLAERGFSGGENQLLATLRYLQASGHEQLLVLNERGRFQAHARDLGLEFSEQRFRNNFDRLAARSLRRRYCEVAPDLIHLACSRSHKIGALATVFGKSLPPRVVTRRMDYPIAKTAFHRWIYGGAVQGVVAISEGVRAAILALGIDPAMVYLINEGVDTASFGALRQPARRAAARARLELADGDIFGVTTASLHVRKAHELLLRALAGLTLPRDRRLVWLFGGDGPERARLTAQAAQLPAGIEVRIPGQIDDVPEALAAADLFCLPSRYEGLGVALLEALASGVPCIASRVGGMREVLVSGESGIHFEVGDVAGLSQAIQLVVDRPEWAAALGEAGMRGARERFDVGLMGRATEALYLRLAGRTAD